MIKQTRVLATFRRKGLKHILRKGENTGCKIVFSLSFFPQYLCSPMALLLTVNGVIHRRYLFFSVKDRNLFHRVDTIGNIFTGHE